MEGSLEAVPSLLDSPSFNDRLLGYKSAYIHLVIVTCTSKYVSWFFMDHLPVKCFGTGIRFW